MRPVGAMTNFDGTTHSKIYVKFTLYDTNNTVIETKATDKNGKVIFDKLELGTYTVKETEGVDGYKVNDTSWTFTLTSAQSVLTKEVINQKESGQQIYAGYPGGKESQRYY